MILILIDVFRPFWCVHDSFHVMCEPAGRNVWMIGTSSDDQLGVMMVLHAGFSGRFSA